MSQGIDGGEGGQLRATLADVCFARWLTRVQKARQSGGGSVDSSGSAHRGRSQPCRRRFSSALPPLHSLPLHSLPALYDRSPTYLPSVCKGGDLLVLVEAHQRGSVALALGRQQLGDRLPDAAGAALQGEAARQVGEAAGKVGGGGGGSSLATAFQTPPAGVATKRLTGARAIRRRQGIHAPQARGCSPTNVPAVARVLPGSSLKKIKIKKASPEHRVGSPASVLLVVDDLERFGKGNAGFGFRDG